MKHTLKELRSKIEDEVPYVDIKPYSHNIIGILLRQIDSEFGRAEANKAIRDLGLQSLGWTEEPESPTKRSCQC